MVARKRTAQRSVSPTELIIHAYFDHPVDPQRLKTAIESLDIPEPGFVGGENYPTLLDAAVATVLLGTVEGQLPQWASEGVFGRRHTKHQREVSFKPEHLFTLNWADSGPGFSWPTAYYATSVAQHHATIVTASADSPDAFGFTDFAIGHFPADADILAQARDVIVRHWRGLQIDGQARWAYLIDVGLVSEAQASQWAVDVWTDSESSE